LARKRSERDRVLNSINLENSLVVLIPVIQEFAVIIPPLHSGIECQSFSGCYERQRTLVCVSVMCSLISLVNGETFQVEDSNLRFTANSLIWDQKSLQQS
jgi:hypothetical protein